MIFSLRRSLAVFSIAKCLSGALLAGDASAPGCGCLTIPDSASPVRLTLYTNASAGIGGVINSFGLSAYGEELIKAPAVAASALEGMAQILINGSGATLNSTNSLRFIERASGEGWVYFGFDATGAYADRVKLYERGILYVQPDLFIVRDHLVGLAPVEFKQVLHLPTQTRIDPVWRDLRLELERAGLRVNVPSERGWLRAWEKVPAITGSAMEGTSAFQAGPTNGVAQLDMLTIFAVHSGANQTKCDFKLLESSSAIGARIHRDGLPTLVAFRRSADTQEQSLTGFQFKGPVGVTVFRPAARRKH